MLRDIFFKDFGWKLFSLLLAAFIWYTVQRITEEPKAVAVSPADIQVQYGEVPVFLVATGADVHRFGLSSNVISVTVSGPPAVMKLLQEDQLHATVDFSGWDEKSKALSRRVDVSAPWGVTVLDVEPPKLLIVPPHKP